MTLNFRLKAFASPVLRLAAVVAIVGSVSACGYALVGRGTALPPGVASISIPTFQNKSGEPELDIIVTSAVRDAFTLDGRLAVDDSGRADSTLTGVIESYSLQPVAFKPNGVASEYNVILVISIIHKSTRPEKILIKQKVSVDWRYVAQGTIIASEGQRLLATKEAAKKAAEALISLVIEAF
jgi:outer membrane lipopolysaccharide assembly protein LptE/RlpB